MRFREEPTANDYKRGMFGLEAGVDAGRFADQRAAIDCTRARKALVPLPSGKDQKQPTCRKDSRAVGIGPMKMPTRG
jgi:hypothetical protein